MKSKPEISVITVCYNSADDLLETIDSVSRQTYSDLEYIVIDGGSSDHTIQILKNSNRVDKYISEPDLGIFDAMNKGASLASSEYLLYLNAGDHFSSPYALEAYASKMRTEDADIFFGRMLWVDIFKKHVHPTNRLDVRFVSQLYNDRFPHPATCYKKSLFDRLGGFDISFQIMADYEFNLRALIDYKTRFQIIEVVLVCFHTGGVSTSSEFSQLKQEEDLRIQKAYFDKNGISKIFPFFEHLPCRKLNNIDYL